MVRHFVARGRTRDILVVVGARLTYPPVGCCRRRCVAKEPLWLDGRGSRRPSRAILLRLVAGMLDVGFDALWQRHRRQRRFVLSKPDGASPPYVPASRYAA